MEDARGMRQDGVYTKEVAETTEFKMFEDRDV